MQRGGGRLLDVGCVKFTWHVSELMEGCRRTRPPDNCWDAWTLLSRLGTRTKEFNLSASVWAENPHAQ